MATGGRIAAKEAEHVIAKAVQRAGVRDAERIAARTGAHEAERAAARTADREVEGELARSASRARELQAMLPEGSRGRVTMGSGVGRDAEGNLVRVVGTSERNGYLRKGVTLDASEQLARGPGHAETSILDHMAQNGITPVGVGAGRPVCPNCADALNHAGAAITTPLRGR